MHLNELSISKAGHSITKLLDTMSASCQWSNGERLVPGGGTAIYGLYGYVPL